MYISSFYIKDEVKDPAILEVVHILSLDLSVFNYSLNELKIKNTKDLTLQFIIAKIKENWITHKYNFCPSIKPYKLRDDLYFKDKLIISR